jgi:hypothetical protein
MDAELDRLQLKGMRDFYSEVVGAMDKFKVTKSDCNLCMLIACKKQDTPYA